MVKEIGDYLIDTDVTNIIGKGSYGQVFLGKHVRTGKEIAAKMFEWEKDLKSEEMDREANNLMKLPDHENVIRILDYIKTDTQDEHKTDTQDEHKTDTQVKRKEYIRIWLILEYCTLGNLADYAWGTSLSFMKKTELMLQSARGLQHLHEQKLIHRDVKPQNILVTGSSENPTIKLADFGQSKFIPERMILATLSLQGTTPYMAPEMFSQVGDKKNPESVDVFSLGVTDHALLTAVAGKAMTPMTEDDEELGKFLYRQSGPTAQVHIYAPEDTKDESELKYLLTTMLAKDPDDRPSSKQVVKALSHLLTTVRAGNLGPKPPFLGGCSREEKKDEATAQSAPEHREVKKDEATAQSAPEHTEKKDEATAQSAPTSTVRRYVGNLVSCFSSILPVSPRRQVENDEATVQSAPLMRRETDFDPLPATESHKKKYQTLPNMNIH